MKKLVIILLLGISCVAFAQKVTITGVVSASDGHPIIGVFIAEKGTQSGTSTDMEGKYSIKASENAVLIFSSIGYKTQEMTVGKASVIDVVMEDDLSLLDEVIVIGYGTQKKINVTGAVSMVDAEVLEARPVMNVGQALQGVIPGLNFSVNNQGGTLNNKLNVNIRGAGTIGDGSNSAPLVLIDGMEGDMNAINPHDILSVSVLKDAASSAIYGSRAAFGVILITTKTGKPGKAVINYSGNVRFTDALAVPDMLDSYKFAQYFNRASQNSGANAIYSDVVMDRIVAYQKGEITTGTVAWDNGQGWENYMGANANTDWFAEMYKDWVPSQEHNVSVSGGGENVTYLVSGNFLDQNGLIRHGGDEFNRYTLNARINAKLSDYVRLNYSSKWIREEYDRPSYMTGVFFHNIARRWPSIPVKDNNGNYMEGVEIIQMRDGGRDKDQKDQLYSQIHLVIEPIKNWKIYVEGNMNTMTRSNHWDVLPIYAHNPAGDPYLTKWDDSNSAGSSRASENSWKENLLSTNIYSDYFKQFDSGHYFKVMVGFNAEQMKTRNLSGTKDNLITSDIPTLNTATDNALASGGYAHWSTAGFFGRINYNYKERYLLEVNMRYDGTSRFIGDKTWGLFPSFSAGWNIAEESFFLNSPIANYIDMIKIRGSWGQLGNMNTKAWYPFYQNMPIGTQNGSWLVDGKKPNTASAPGIVSSLMTWETVESWNVGVDIGAFNNRLMVVFDYFMRSTKEMIGPAPELPSILGTSVPKINNADLESYGFELELSWRDQIGDFQYGIRGILSDDQQRVTRYPNENGDISQWYSGKYSGEIWGYETVGIAQSDQEMNDHLASLPNGAQDALGSKWAAGDVMYRDLNGDGKIDLGAGTLEDPGDRKIIGNSTARFKYGITLDAAWKGLDISVFFQGIGKRDYALGGPYFWGASGNEWQSAGFEEHWDFFRPEGDPLGANLDSFYPRPLFGGSDKNQKNQSRYLQDASYLRLKNLQIGYTVPSKIMNKIGMQSLRVYVSGDNLWTLSSMSAIFDPEVIGSDWGDGKLYPLSRTISVGLSLNF